MHRGNAVSGRLREEEETEGEVHTITMSGKKRPRDDGEEEIATGWKNSPCGWKDLWTWFGELRREFGDEYLVAVAVAQHGIKGFSRSMTGHADVWVWRSYNLPAQTMSIYGSISHLPWALKPITGLVSDMFPLGGYYRRPYILLATLIGVISLAGIGVIPQIILAAPAVVVLLAGIQFQDSCVDLMTEASYAERVGCRGNPKMAPALLTFVWYGMSVGILAGRNLGGFLIQYAGPRSTYLSVIPLSIAALCVSRKNYLGETRETDADRPRIKRRRLWEQNIEIFILGGVLVLGSLFLIVSGFVTRDATTHLIVGLTMVAFVAGSFASFLRPEIAKPVLFYLLHHALNPGTGGAGFYFYTDTEAQFENGLHFTPVFMNGVLGTVGFVFTSLGMVLYARYGREMTYVSILTKVCLVKTSLSMLDVAFFARLNRRWGIPDWAFMVGSDALEEVVSTWSYMPGVVMIGQLCPRGIEGSMYALIAGCENFGGSVRAYIQVWFMEYYQCNPSGRDREDQEFDNIWKLSLLGVITAFGWCLMVPFFIPNVKQTEALLDGEDMDTSRGSLYWKWKNRNRPVDRGASAGEACGRGGLEEDEEAKWEDSPLLEKKLSGTGGLVCTGTFDETVGSGTLSTSDSTSDLRSSISGFF